ncbi:MAG: hypothetical protein ACHQFX_13705, partial [Chitinophagales bacterium]
MKTGNFIIIVLAGCIIFAGCNNTRHIPAGDKLYTGARVSVSGTSTVREKKVLQEDLGGLTRPKPNSKFLGLRVKLSIYSLFRKSKDNSIFGKIRDKNGEPPVLLSELDLDQNKLRLQNHLENKGYFRAKVTGDTVVRRKKARATYQAEAGPQYKIATVHFPDDSTELVSTIRKSIDNTLLVPGKPFDIDVIRAERVRIDAYLKENGFYFFSPDFILLKTDTTIGNHLVNMYVTIKADIPAEAKQVYRIRNVQIYAGYSLNTAQIDTSRSEGEYYKGYYIIDRRNRFKPALFADIMKFEPGDVYNRTDHNFTLSRLANLDVFKFVKNRFAINSQTDSAYLDAFYYLTPLPKKSLSAEVTTITRSNNLNGSVFSLKWKNRNTFRKGEQLSVGLYTGSDVQFSGALKGHNVLRYGGEINFAIPRFFVPFKKFKSNSGYLPRTNIV